LRIKQAGTGCGWVELSSQQRVPNIILYTDRDMGAQHKFIGVPLKIPALCARNFCDANVIPCPWHLLVYCCSYVVILG